MSAHAPTSPTPPLPYATAALPGCGGTLRAAPDDFAVEELPAYLPSGAGEHLYLWIEKRGLSTAAVAAHLARVLEVPPAAIGGAGKKDAQAVARQWLSVHTPSDPDPAALALVSASGGLRVLAASRHGNKLRPGHLRGNRFRIVLRDARRDGSAEAVLERLAGEGLPNYFGTQRLGPGLDNARAGRRLLRGGGPRGVRSGPALERARFVVNAYQSALFNALVAQRLGALGSLETLLAGDLALLHRNGAAFAVDEAGLADAQARAAAHELSPSAPLFGYRVTLAAGQPGAWEQALLAREGLGAESFRLRNGRLSPKGERRAVRAFATDLRWVWQDATDAIDAAGSAAVPALTLEFTLAPGVYATALLREVMKNDDLRALPDAAD
jgi:tRNA pseudouridine13 synthase